MDFSKLCQDILALDSKVRYAGVCDDSGEIKYGGQREGVINLLSEEETKHSNLQALARWGLRNSLAPKIGQGRYAMAEYEKIKRITIPLGNDHLLLITTEVDADHMNIINEALNIIKSN
ncbi:MAG: hypothetical protein DA328_09460 [Nitrososphaeraceae archaeon]|nr:hypothetical protein [Nitrososphaeraceae archaeon]